MIRKGIAVGGNLVVDYVKIIDSFPKLGNLASILSISKSVGGALPNVLIDLAKMDKDIYLEAIGLAGCDEDGDYIIETLDKNEINTYMIEREPSKNTSFTDVMTVESTGARTFFHYRGTNELLNINHFDFSKIKAELLHIGYALLLDAMDSPDEEYGTVMAKTLSLAQENGIKTSLDVVSENSNRFSKIVPPSLKYTNYCIINEVEAALITQIPARDTNENLIFGNMKKICKRLLEMGVKDWAVIHAPEAGFAMCSEGRYHIQPSLELPKGYIKGTVGAGDAFCAGMLYSIYKGWDMDRALKIAAGAAASSLSEVNSTDGMTDIHSIEKMIDTIPERKF